MRCTFAYFEPCVKKNVRNWKVLCDNVYSRSWLYLLIKFPANLIRLTNVIDDRLNLDVLNVGVTADFKCSRSFEATSMFRNDRELLTLRLEERSMPGIGRFSDIWGVGEGDDRQEHFSRAKWTPLRTSGKTVRHDCYNGIIMVIHKMV